jgi:hypothetical protein
MRVIMSGTVGVRRRSSGLKWELEYYSVETWRGIAIVRRQIVISDNLSLRMHSHDPRNWGRGGHLMRNDDSGCQPPDRSHASHPFILSFD